MDDNLIKYLSHYNGVTDKKSGSLDLKSSRYQKFNFCKRQNKKFGSLKCSVPKNISSNSKQDHNRTQTTNKKIENKQQTFWKESLQKNSLMNKIISQQKKNKNFTQEKNHLLESLYPKSIQDSINQKYLVNFSNGKILSLLNQRPFQKRGSFGIPFSKLKMIKNLKQNQRKNFLINHSVNLSDYRPRKGFEKQTFQNSQRTISEQKRNSFNSEDKSKIDQNQSRKQKIKMNLLGKFSKLQGSYSQYKENDNSKEKKSLLTISDDQNDVKSSSGASLLKLTKIRISTQTPQIQREKGSKCNRLKKCQDKIISDLKKLQKLRYEQSLNNRDQLQLKNLKSNFFTGKNSKYWMKSRQNQKQSRKSKYIVKFKTEPKESPLEKLKQRIHFEIKEDELRHKEIKRQALFMSDIKGNSKTFEKRRNLSELVGEKYQKEKRFKIPGINTKINYFQKQLSGWENVKQADPKQNWSLIVF